MPSRCTTLQPIAPVAVLGERTRPRVRPCSRPGAPAGVRSPRALHAIIITASSSEADAILPPGTTSRRAALTRTSLMAALAAAAWTGVDLSLPQLSTAAEGPAMVGDAKSSLGDAESSLGDA
jgi:hypothetical protein